MAFKLLFFQDHQFRTSPITELIYFCIAGECPVYFHQYLQILLLTIIRIRTINYVRHADEMNYDQCYQLAGGKRFDTLAHRC